MKKLFVIIASLLLTVAAGAQTEKVKQRVELKNGNEVVGYVAEQSDGSYLVETESGDMFFYSASEIKKIVEIDDVKVKTVKLKDKPDEKGSYEKSANTTAYKTKGYMGMVSGVFGMDFGISVINGYRFSPHFYLGLGVGVGYGLIMETIHTPEINIYMMSEFSKKRVAMFADLTCGFNYDLYEETMNAQSSITFGVRNRFKKNPNKAMWWGLNFGIRGYSYYYEYYESGVTPTLCAKIAYSF